MLTFSWRRSLSYRNQSIDLQIKLMAGFYMIGGHRQERVKRKLQLFHGNHWLSTYTEFSRKHVLDRGWEMPVFGKFCVRTKWMTPWLVLESFYRTYSWLVYTILYWIIITTIENHNKTRSWYIFCPHKNKYSTSYKSGMKKF